MSHWRRGGLSADPATAYGTTEGSLVSRKNAGGSRIRIHSALRNGGLPVGKETVTDLGRIALSEEVIATIAGVAATECYGIVGMASRKLKDGIAVLLGRESLSKGVEVSIDGERVLINLYTIVGYGTRISEVARNVCDQVKYTVESTTGLQVTKVNVFVQGVKVGNAK